jgi:hypothetical protein
MNNTNFKITVSSRTAMAKAYGISLQLFKEWVAAEKELQKQMNKYKRTFPPHITRLIVEVFGAPY